MDLRDLFKREGTTDSAFNESGKTQILSRINGTLFVPDCESVTAGQGNAKTLLVGLTMAQK